MSNGLFSLVFSDKIKMLCTRGLLGCSRKSAPNRSVYEPTTTCSKVLKSRNSTKDTPHASKDSLISKPPKAPRTYHPNPQTPNMGCLIPDKIGAARKSKGIKSGRLAASSQVPSGIIAMSPWKREVIRRSQQSLYEDEDKENSVMSHASSIISRTTSLSSVHTMVSSVSSRIGGLAIRGKLCKYAFISLTNGSICLTSTGGGYVIVEADK